MAELARKNEDGTISLVCCPREQGQRMAELRNSGFLDFVASEQPQSEPGKVAFDSFEIVDGKLVQTWDLKEDVSAYETEIKTLKASLAESDYQVTKCYEASLVGDALPYDIGALHAKRQEIRDKINELQAKMASNA